MEALSKKIRRELISRIFRRRKTKDGYGRRSSEETYNIYKEPEIDMLIKSIILPRLGHIRKFTEGRGFNL